jgi:hypothetical protein
MRKIRDKSELITGADAKKLRRTVQPLCQIAYHYYYFEYYTLYAIIILRNGVKCEVRKWKLN